jgi:hypothetical protein
MIAADAEEPTDFAVIMIVINMNEVTFLLAETFRTERAASLLFAPQIVKVALRHSIEPNQSSFPHRHESLLSMFAIADAGDLSTSFLVGLIPGHPPSTLPFNAFTRIRFARESPEFDTARSAGWRSLVFACTATAQIIEEMRIAVSALDRLERMKASSHKDCWTITQHYDFQSMLRRR